MHGMINQFVLSRLGKEDLSCEYKCHIFDAIHKYLEFKNNLVNAIFCQGPLDSVV